MWTFFQPLWTYLTDENGIVRGAPVLFGVSVFLTALVIGTPIVWAALSWRYSGLIENRDSQIQLLSFRNADLQKQLEQAKGGSPQAVSDPDAITQRGERVGQAIAPQADLSSGVYRFKSLQVNGNFNKAASFSFRGLVLRINTVSTEHVNSMAGEVRQQLVDVVCVVVEPK